MSASSYLLGLDISTTAAKALLVDSAGQVAGVASTPLSVSSPRPLWSEQAPADWWAGMVAAIRRVLSETGIAGEAVAAIGLTGQMHGLVLLDEAGEVLRPAILWNDQRTAAQCDEIRARVGRERLIRICGNDALTGFTAPKILWVREHEPELLRQSRHVLLPKDYIRYRLTAYYAMDCADGSGTMLFDLAAATGRPNCSTRSISPRMVPAGLRRAVDHRRRQRGRGGRDGPAGRHAHRRRRRRPGGAGRRRRRGRAGHCRPDAGHVGRGLRRHGTALVQPEGRLHAFCHAVPGRWHFMGVMLSAAGSLRWYRDSLGARRPFRRRSSPGRSQSRPAARACCSCPT